MSRPPNAATLWATRSLTCSGSVTSAVWAWTIRPDARSRVAAASTSAALRAQMATSTPSAVSSSAMARPMPFEPPVTSARRPVSPSSNYSPAPAGRGVPTRCVFEEGATRWCEDIDLTAGGVFGARPVRDPRRDDRDIAGAHGAHLAVELELELALQHDGELLLDVDVHGRLGVRLEGDEVDQAALAEDGPERQAGDELHRLDIIHDHVAARRCRGAPRLGAEVLDRLGHRFSSADRMSVPRRETPSSMVASSARLNDSRRVLSPSRMRVEGAAGDERDACVAGALCERHGVQ